MIRRARIVNVLGNADKGRFGAKLVSLAFFEHNYEVAAYAKKLDDRQLLVEVISALIGRAIGLPIPAPVLAIALNDDSIWFASIDVKYPDVTKQLIIADGKVQNTQANHAILKKLTDWP